MRGFFHGVAKLLLLASLFALVAHVFFGFEMRPEATWSRYLLTATIIFFFVVITGVGTWCLRPKKEK